MYLPVADSDIADVVGLMNRAYRGSDGWTTEASYIVGERTTEALLRAELLAKPAAVLLKWVDGEAKDFNGCVWLEPLGDATWYLGSLTIDPERQNGGLGRIMLAAAEAWACRHGARRVQLTVVDVRETLIAWYIRRGYARTGATEPFPYGDTRFGRPLRDDLCFVVFEKRFGWS